MPARVAAAVIGVSVGLAAGCQRASARERDCAEVRAILAAPDPANPPRRYWDYAPAQAAVFDPSPLDRLKKLAYRDPAVREAVLAFVNDTGWTFYTPYSADIEPSGTRQRLDALCGLSRARVETR